MDQELFFKNRNGSKLCAKLAVPDEAGPFPVVIGVHGFGSNKDDSKLDELAKRLTEKGIALFRYDTMGIGKSEGDFIDKTLSNDSDNLHDAIEFIKKDYKKIGVFGSSWGGMVSIVEASRNGEIKSLALASPVTFFKKYESYFGEKAIEEAKKTGILVNKSPTKGTERRLKLEFLTDGMKYKTNEIAANIKCSVLLVHGDADDVIPYSNSKDFVDMLECRKKIVTVKGCGHYYKNEKHFEVLIDSVVDFFEKNL